MSEDSRTDVKDLIPHRSPFLFVDELEEVVAGVRARGVFRPSVDAWYQPGHFPGRPVVPGVLLIEAMAQVGAAAVLSSDEYRGKLAYFAGIDHARFRKIVLPGDTVVIDTEMIRSRGRYGVARARALVDGQLAVEAELAFAVEE